MFKNLFFRRFSLFPLCGAIAAKKNIHFLKYVIDELGRILDVLFEIGVPLEFFINSRSGSIFFITYRDEHIFGRDDVELDPARCAFLRVINGQVIDGEDITVVIFHLASVGRAVNLFLNNGMDFKRPFRLFTSFSEGERRRIQFILFILVFSVIFTTWLIG